MPCTIPGLCIYAYTTGAGLLCTAQNGRRVLLLERDVSQPDRIVGELLQPGGYLMLKRLGLAHVLDNIDAQKVRGFPRHHALLLLVMCAQVCLVVKQVASCRHNQMSCSNASISERFWGIIILDRSKAWS